MQEVEAGEVLAAPARKTARIVEAVRDGATLQVTAEVREEDGTTATYTASVGVDELARLSLSEQRAAVAEIVRYARDRERVRARVDLDALLGDVTL